MSGRHSDHTVHRLVSGEIPVVGMRVIDNDLSHGVIVEVATDAGCGWYCNAWHKVQLDTDYKGNPIKGTNYSNCERLATSFEGEPA